jgi:RimJ/RimL family protein N-acetyltransferase
MAEIPSVTTARLFLRPFQLVDGPSVERFAGAREVADTTLAIPHPYPAGAGAQWIAMHDAAWQRRENLVLAICDRRAPADLLGAISLRVALAHAHGEVGYWIRADDWGKGYATEAVRALFGYAFESLGLHRIQGRHFTRNPASGRVMLKAGMRLEGIHRAAFRRWEQFEDVAVYAILAPEWQAIASTFVERQ